jgi:formylglycine-generating enzyme required for sulfatase activity
MVHIRGGSYVAGIDSADIPALLTRYDTRHPQLFSLEVPRRRVRVEAFQLDRTEVTKGAFRQFLLRHPRWRKGAVAASDHNGRYLEDWTGLEHPAGEQNHPVTFITWGAAQAFCAWAGGRLPTEDEWEYAAAGGLTRPEFPWGDAMPDSTRANYGGSRLKRPTDVARYQPNGFGLHDMAGNVWELLGDRWAYQPDTVTVPREVRYALRGGSYGGDAINLRIRYRDSHRAGDAGPHVGFRCGR